MHYYYVEHQLSHSFQVSNKTLVQQELVTCGTLFTQEVVNAGAQGPFKNMIFPVMPIEKETLEMYKVRNVVYPIVLIMGTEAPLLNR